MPLTAERRSEIDARQGWIADLLSQVAADQVLLLEPANQHWFAGAPLCRGILDPAEQPALVISANQRWLICSNVDTQRIFDNFLDDLGFQLKEWPWHTGREQLLADVCQNRVVASDRFIRDATYIGDKVRLQRLYLSPLAQARLRETAFELAHALEATARNFDRGDSEQEVAGQLGHRLLHRGLEPLVLQVAADGRSIRDPRPGFTELPVHSWCLLWAQVRCGGMHAAATRTAWFGTPEEEFRKHYAATGPIHVARRLIHTPGLKTSEVIAAGQRVAVSLGFEHAWHDSPHGWLTGWLSSERMLGPLSDQPLDANVAITWQCRIGSAVTLDTDLITSQGPELLTATDVWPMRRYKLGDRIVDLPDVLVR